MADLLVTGDLPSDLNLEELSEAGFAAQKLLGETMYGQ
jgi:hypothetical protein